MTDEQIMSSILEDIDNMSDEELFGRLKNTPSSGLGELFEFKSTLRREELGKGMNEQKLECPECGTRQVQLVGYIDIYPAQWKCRHCKHNFEWEGA